MSIGLAMCSVIAFIGLLSASRVLRQLSVLSEGVVYVIVHLCKLAMFVKEAAFSHIALGNFVELSLICVLV